MFLLILALSLFGCNNGAPRAVNELIRYNGDQLWRVEHSALAKITLKELVRQVDFTIWNANAESIDVFVANASVEYFRQCLLEANIQYEVNVEDYQKVIDEENPTQAEIEYLQGKSAHNLTWQAYHRLADIHSYLDYLVETYPELCSIETIGHTIENRPLKVIKVSNGVASNKAIWIDGGIHAREWVSPASVTYILNELVLNWNDHPDYIRTINWYILPVINPDGYEHSHTTERLWRKNRNKEAGSCYGVDLNRNYGFKWGGKGSSGLPCSEIYRGRSAFSELESTAQKKFFEKTKENFYAFLTFHSYGQYILYPWGFEYVPCIQIPDE